MQLSAIVIGFLLVGLVSASNPGGYWTVYSSQECSSGTEILYSWFNAFPVRQLNYKFSLVYSSVLNTAGYQRLLPQQYFLHPIGLYLSVLHICCERYKLRFVDV
jgi:hypothetical protein